MCHVGTLDLSAAFDTIDHTLFLDRMKLENMISGSPHAWLKSYFMERYQCVNVNGTSSQKKALTTGFPQGSKLGTSGFKPYTKPLTKIAAKHGISIHLYADDTQLYLSFRQENTSIALKQMEACEVFYSHLKSPENAVASSE